MGLLIGLSGFSCSWLLQQLGMCVTVGESMRRRTISWSDKGYRTFLRESVFHIWQYNCAEIEPRSRSSTPYAVLKIYVACDVMICGAANHIDIVKNRENENLMLLSQGRETAKTREDSMLVNLLDLGW